MAVITLDCKKINLQYGPTFAYNLLHQIPNLLICKSGQSRLLVQILVLYDNLDFVLIVVTVC